MKRQNLKMDGQVFCMVSNDYRQGGTFKLSLILAVTREMEEGKELRGSGRRESQSYSQEDEK